MALRDPEDVPPPAPAPAPAPLASFPQDPAEFDSDPRISFSKLDNKFILETEDGQEFEYDTALKRWIPTVGVPAVVVVGCFSSPILGDSYVGHVLRGRG